MVDAEERAVDPQFLRSHSQFYPLQQRITCRPGAGTLYRTPVAEGQEANSFHALHNIPAAAAIPAGYAL
jgi:hypothetical protein